MKKLIVAVFENQTDAFEAAGALNELHFEGDITIYGSAIIEKDEAGKLSTLQQKDSGASDGWAAGFMGGGLLGALAGPAGLAIGASLGGLAGLTVDLERVGIDVEFAEEVAHALSPGKTAVIMDIEEGWVTPVDTRVEQHNGIVFRRNRTEKVDDQLLRESRLLNAEYKELSADMSESDEQTKVEMREHIEDLDKKIEVTRTLVNQRLKEVRLEASEKSEALQSQFKDASSSRKKKIHQRMDELKSNTKVSEAKLEDSLENLLF